MDQKKGPTGQRGRDGDVSRTYADGCDNCGAQRWQPMTHADGAPYLRCAECGRTTAPPRKRHDTRTEEEVRAERWEGWERELAALHAALMKEAGALDMDVGRAHARGLRLLEVELSAIRLRVGRLAAQTDRLLRKRQAA